MCIVSDYISDHVKFLEAEILFMNINMEIWKYVYNITLRFIISRILFYYIYIHMYVCM